MSIPEPKDLKKLIELVSSVGEDAPEAKALAKGIGLSADAGKLTTKNLEIVHSELEDMYNILSSDSIFKNEAAALTFLEFFGAQNVNDSYKLVSELIKDGEITLQALEKAYIKIYTTAEQLKNIAVGSPAVMELSKASDVLQAVITRIKQSAGMPNQKVMPPEKVIKPTENAPKILQNVDQPDPLYKFIDQFSGADNPAYVKDYIKTIFDSEIPSHFKKICTDLSEEVEHTFNKLDINQVSSLSKAKNASSLSDEELQLALTHLLNRYRTVNNFSNIMFASSKEFNLSPDASLSIIKSYPPSKPFSQIVPSSKDKKIVSAIKQEIVNSLEASDEHKRYVKNKEAVKRLVLSYSELYDNLIKEASKRNLFEIPSDSRKLYDAFSNETTFYKNIINSSTSAKTPAKEAPDVIDFTEEVTEEFVSPATKSAQEAFDRAKQSVKNVQTPDGTPAPDLIAKVEELAKRISAIEAIKRMSPDREKELNLIIKDLQSEMLSMATKISELKIPPQTKQTVTTAVQDGVRNGTTAEAGADTVKAATTKLSKEEFKAEEEALNLQYKQLRNAQLANKNETDLLIQQREAALLRGDTETATKISQQIKRKQEVEIQTRLDLEEAEKELRKARSRKPYKTWIKDFVAEATSAEKVFPWLALTAAKVGVAASFAIASGISTVVVSIASFGAMLIVPGALALGAWYLYSNTYFNKVERSVNTISSQIKVVRQDIRGLNLENPALKKFFAGFDEYLYRLDKEFQKTLSKDKDEAAAALQSDIIKRGLDSYIKVISQNRESFKQSTGVDAWEKFETDLDDLLSLIENHSNLLQEISSGAKAKAKDNKEEKSIEFKEEITPEEVYEVEIPSIGLVRSEVPLGPKFRSAIPSLARRVLETPEGYAFWDPNNIWGGFVTKTNNKHQDVLNVLKFFFNNQIHSRISLNRFINQKFPKISRDKFSGYKEAVRYYRSNPPRNIFSEKAR